MSSYITNKLFRSQNYNIPSFVRNNQKYIHSAFPERLKELNIKIREHISRVFGEQLLIKSEELKKRLEREIEQYLITNDYKFEGKHIQLKLTQDIINSVVGWGVLDQLINDDNIQEIAVIRYDQIIVKRMFQPGWIETSVKFASPYEAKIFVDNILSQIGRRIDKLNPIEDARLSDGSRLAVSLNDVSLNGLSFNIRKFPKEKITIDKLIEYETIDNYVADFLKLIVKGKLNTLISGGTATGKTTLLNVLSSMIDDQELIITLEDSAELQIEQPFRIQFEERKPNIEGKGQISLDYLLKHTLRRAPDRIIVGEMRSEEAKTLMDAMATGHDGVLSSVHADSPQACVTRTSQLASKGDPSTSASEYERLFGQRINLIIQLKNLANGVKKLTHITACIYDYSNNITKLIDVIKWEFTKGEFLQVNPLPYALVEKMLNNGVNINELKRSYFDFEMSEAYEESN